MLLSFVKSKQSLLAVLLLLMFASCKQSEFYDKSQLLDGASAPTSNDGSGSAPTDGNGGGNTGGGDTGGPTLCENGSTDNLICNPLGGGDGSNPTNPGGDVPAVPVSKLGLIAHLYEGQNQWNNLDQYFASGYKHEEDIYFSNFDVPTRAFDEGFGYGANDYLTNRNGEKLIEWFAIKANGNMMLPDSETAGSYHIVTISDDGIQVTVDGKTIISNTSVHAPTIDCAKDLVQFNSKEAKSFELGYFQGPRVLIALQTFIKKIDNVEDFKNESFCSTGNGPDVLIQNGYKVISSAWFTLPAGY